MANDKSEGLVLGELDGPAPSGMLSHLLFTSVCSKLLLYACLVRRQRGQIMTFQIPKFSASGCFRTLQSHNFQSRQPKRWFCKTRSSDLRGLTAHQWIPCPLGSSLSVWSMPPAIKYFEPQRAFFVAESWVYKANRRCQVLSARCRSRLVTSFCLCIPCPSTLFHLG